MTDAWQPQTNGVVNTLVRLVKHLESQGTEVLVVAPDGHRTLPLPSYPEIRVALRSLAAIPRIRAFAPDAIHVATEGPLGFWTIGWLRRKGLRFTTSFHTRYAEYLSARAARAAGVGLQAGALVPRAAPSTRWSARCRCCASSREARRAAPGALAARRRRRRSSTRGTGATRSTQLPRPIWLYVGRVAVEKSLEDFLELPLPGTKVVVGDGPSREGLQRRYPDVVWRGYRYGDDLSAHFASADCFVFPSRTETFGNVLLEAMASGLPVASVPAPGPVDLINEGVNGAIDDDLLDACLRAIALLAREGARQHRAADAAGGPRGVPRAPGPAAAADAVSCRRARGTRRARPALAASAMPGGGRLSRSGQPQQRLPHLDDVALGCTPSREREPGGREHDDRRAELEPAHLLALAKGRVAARSRWGRGSARCSSTSRKCSRMLATRIDATGTSVTRWPRARQARRRTARSFLQNSCSTRLTVIGLMFQVSPEM